MVTGKKVYRIAVPAGCEPEDPWLIGWRTTPLFRTFCTRKDQGLGASAKPLIHLRNLVGGAGFEPATPAV
jgi:hypothetical protein